MDSEKTHLRASVPQGHYSDFRLDPLTDRWTLIAEGRGKRPESISSHRNGGNGEGGNDKSPTAVSESEAQDAAPRKDCAFCPGNEQITTETVAAIVENPDANGEKSSVKTLERDGNLEGFHWLGRVIENKFPAFRIDPEHFTHPKGFDELRRLFYDGKLSLKERFFQKIDAVGRHEVAIDARRHLRGWAEMSEEEIVLAFRLLQSRLQEFRASGLYDYAFFFKNVGVNAGASQPHTHCQLTGNVVIPDDVYAQVKRVARYERVRREHGESASFWEALMEMEIEAGLRIVAKTDSFALYCPYASRFPLQVEICPLFDGAFEDYDASTLSEVAKLARNALIALQETKRRYRPFDLTPLDYNVVMTNQPYRVESDMAVALAVFRPRLAILPSLVKKAGYEHGSGIDINPIAPETAAAYLRDAFGYLLP